MSEEKQLTHTVEVQEGNFSGKAVAREIPKTYMALSCFTFWCCCIPLGIAAMCFSFVASTSIDEGNYHEARKSSKKAKIASIIGIVFGISILIIIVALYATGILR